MVQGFVGVVILETITAKKLRGISPMGLESFGYSGGSASTFYPPFPELQERERVYLGSGSRFALGGFT